MRTATLATILAAALALAAPAASADNQRTVWWFGDSISRGYGFQDYNYPSFLAHPDEIATTLAAANGHPEIAVKRTETQDINSIWALRANRTIRAGDRILFEDAGPHAAAPAYRQWLTLIAMVARPAQVTFTTMFDYQPQLPNSQYDPAINKVIRGVAAASKARLLDWNRQMDTARATLEPQGVRVVWPDGIHPTVFGNIMLAASIVRAEGVTLSNVDPVVDELVAQQERIVKMGMAPAFTRAQASAWTRIAVR